MTLMEALIGRERKLMEDLEIWYRVLEKGNWDTEMIKKNIKDIHNKLQNIKQVLQDLKSSSF